MDSGLATRKGGPVNAVMERTSAARVSRVADPVRYLVVRAHPSPVAADAYNSQELGIASHLRAQGVRVTIAAAEQSTGADIGLRFASRVPSLARIANIADVDLAGSDVIQISDLFLPGNLQAVSRAPSTARFILYQGHYWGPSGRARWLQLAQSRLTASRLRKHRHVVLAKSEAAARLAERCGLGPAIVVGVGLDTRRLLGATMPLPAAVARFLAEPGFVFLYVGALDARRRLDWVLPHLRAPELRAARLLVVGRGPARDCLMRDFGDLVAVGRVCFVDRLDQSQLLPAYSRANALVLPTRYEIFGMVGLEALLFDVPVVASDVAGPRALAALAPERVTLVDPGESAAGWRRALLAATKAGSPKSGMRPDPARIDEVSWCRPGRVFIEQIRRLTADDGVPGGPWP